MGQDYKTREVHDVCPATGWPRDEYGHLLNAGSGPENGWETNWRGMKLKELTSPYGALSYVIGSVDDFYCFDYAIITGIGLNRGKWLVLHSTINSETGGFIQADKYEIIPLLDYDRQEVQFVEDALDWCADNEVKHHKSGWNQDPWFFARCVYLSYLNQYEPTEFSFSDRQKRFGGKRIDRLMSFH